jgi:glycosyltransferase involved in cell wall biosynthesis
MKIYMANPLYIPHFGISASGSLSLAMAYGKPVIVSRTEFFFFEEVFGDACASIFLFFPPKDYRMLAQRIIDILLDKDHVKQIARKIKERAIEFSWKKWLSSH